MPDLKKTVEILFQGTDKVSPGVNSVLSGLGKLDAGVQGFAQPLANVTDKILEFETVLAAGAAAITAYSVKLASDFDTAFREIATLIDEPIENLDAFKESILDYSKVSTKSLEDITGSVYSAISAGIDYTDSLKVVEQAERLAVAGKASLSDTLLVLVSSLNAYGASADDAQQYADALFTTVKQGQTTLPELSAALAQVTGLAANTGVSFEELLSAVAALTATGLKTPQAITGIRAALSNILKPTADARDVAAELGIQFNAQALAANGLFGVLGDVREATGGNTEQMTKLFGSVEGVNAVLALTGKGADKFSQSLDAMARNTGAVDAAFEKMADSGDLAVQRIVNAGKAILIGFGGPLLDEFGGVADAIATIFNEIAAQMETGALQEVGDTAEDFAQRVLAAFQSIAKNLPAAFRELDITDLLEAFGRLGEEVQEVFDNLLGDVDLSTPEGLAEAMQNVVNILTALTNVTKGIVEELQPIFEAIGEVANRTGDAGREAQEAAGRFLGAMKLLAEFGTVIGAALITIKESETDIRNVFDVLTGAIKIMVNGAQVAFDTLALSIVKQLARVTKAASLVTFGDFGEQVAQQARDLELYAEAIENNLIRNSYEARDGLEQMGRGFSLVSDEAEKSSDKSSGALEKIQSATDKAKAAVAEAEKAFRATGAASEYVAKQFDTQAVSADSLIESIALYGESFEIIDGKVVPSLKKAAQFSGTLTDNTEKHIKVIKDGEGNIVGFSDGIEGIAGHYESAAKKAEDAAKKTESFLTEMEKIASNERIKKFEIAFDFKSKEAEEETKRIQATFESLNNTINSTGDVIKSAFGVLGDLAGSGASGTTAGFREIEKQLERENKRRDDAVKSQLKLTEAQTKLIEQRAESLRRGDPLISIKADGLEPELEAFMWKILKKVQIRGTEESAEFLLGFTA